MLKDILIMNKHRYFPSQPLVKHKFLVIEDDNGVTEQMPCIG